MADIIQMRRGSASSWTTYNPILAEGEFGFETDTLRFKLGDGLTHWNSLMYSGPRGVFPASAALEIEWSEDYPSNYVEITRVSGKVSSIDVYADNTKAVHIFSKAYTYTSGLLTQVTTTNILTGSTIQKDIVRSGSDISSVTRTYTP